MKRGKRAGERSTRGGFTEGGISNPTIIYYSIKIEVILLETREKKRNEGELEREKERCRTEKKRVKNQEV